MRRSAWLFACLIALCANPLPSALAQEQQSPAEAGREIWFKATAGSERFYTYMRPQRLGAPIDWKAMLAAERRGELFPVWGMLPEPGCCVPGNPDCPATSTAETFGFAWCPGDEALLAGVGKSGWRDPACGRDEPPQPQGHPHVSQRQDSCDLRFGTSAGAVGIRKFPNPRFDTARWDAAGGWDAANGTLLPDGRLLPPDPSVEPPFLIGLTCAACHAGPDPETPPANPSSPAAGAIDGLAGNPYTRLGELLASGLGAHRLEQQMLAPPRPGTALPMPLPSVALGAATAIPAITAPANRPRFEHEVTRWRPVDSCGENTTQANCWCEPDRTAKCWRQRPGVELVPHLGSGGEDTTGFGPALQRAYLAMGSCAETCTGAHLDRPAALEPREPGHGRTAVDPGQCRADCPAFRAIEDRLGQLLAYIDTARPASLWKARGLGDNRDLEIALDIAYFPGAVEQGRALFARHCARCHSSQTGDLENAVFDAVDAGGMPRDWMGSDMVVPAGEIGTDGGRAAATAHRRADLWSAFASGAVAMREPGYRAPTLRGIWASAPYLHNNAAGPELCGDVSAHAPSWRSPYVDKDGEPLAIPPDCEPFDPSARSRYRLFEAAMADLLTPIGRLAKLPMLDRTVVLQAGPDGGIFGAPLGVTVVVPAGLPASLARTLSYKTLVADLELVDEQIERKYGSRLSPEQLELLVTGIGQARALISQSGGIGRIRVMEGLEGSIAAITGPGEIGIDGGFLQAFYGNPDSGLENAGHRFGESLSGREKRALIAFLATL